MNIGTVNYVFTIQIQYSHIPFKYQVNLPWNTLVGLPKAFQKKSNWKYWIKYIKPIWCPQQIEKHVNVHFLVFFRCVYIWNQQIMFHFLVHIRFLVGYSLLFKQIWKKSFFLWFGTLFWSIKIILLQNCTIFSVQYCSMNINMCAKFCGTWDKNDWNMDLRMSAGPNLCYSGTP